MKRKFIISLFLVMVLTLCTGLAFACGGSLTLSATTLELDFYEDSVLQVSDNVADVTWSSSDQTVIKVDQKGNIYTQGKAGTAVVTAKSGSLKGSCTITVNSSRRKPVLKVEDQRAFLNCLTAPVVNTSFKETVSVPDTIKLTSLNTDIVQIVDGKLKGIALGEAQIKVGGTWKGYEFDDKTVNVTVNPETHMEMPVDQPVIYAVKDGTPVRNNTYDLVTGVKVFKEGKLLENPDLTVTATTNPEYVTIDGSKIKVASTPDVDGEIVDLEVTFNGGSAPLTKAMTLKVMPNYEVKSNLAELVPDAKARVVLENYDGTIDGKDGLARYYVPDDEDGKNKHATALYWANWTTRLDLQTTMTAGGVTAHKLIEDNGYQYISFDVYYKGESGMFFGILGYSSYFFCDVQNNRSDILIVEDGVITNTLKAETWQTVYLDINSLIVSAFVAGKSDCNMFLSCNYLEDECFVGNIRYWYDSSALDSFENKVDLEKRTLTVDSENPNKATVPLNEFVVYSPVYTTFEKVEKDGEEVYKYSNENAKDFDFERRSKLNAWNELNGVAVKKGYKYLTFDIFVESGTPRITYYDLYKKSNVNLDLLDQKTVDAYGVKFYDSLGKETNTFKHGEWMSVAVRIDGKAKETFLITALKKLNNVAQPNTVFYLKNNAYYKDVSYEYELGYGDLLRAKAFRLDVAYVNQTFDVTDLIDVRYRGELISDYTVESVTFKDNALSEYTDGYIKILNTGVNTATVTVKKGEFQTTVSFEINAIPDSMILVSPETAELYAGSTGIFPNTLNVEVLAYDNRELVGAERLLLQAIEGAEHVSLNGLTITGVSAGKSVVRVYFVRSDESTVYQDIELILFDTHRQRDGSEIVYTTTDGAVGNYGLTDQTVGDRTGVYKYSTTAKEWTHKLNVKMGGHLNSDQGPAKAKALREMLNANVKYVSVDVYMEAGSVMTVSGLMPDYAYGKDVLTAGATVVNENPYINLYSNKVKITTVPSGAWFTVFIDYSKIDADVFAQTARTYSRIEFGGILGTVYFDNVRYYHDGSWLLDYEPSKALTVDTQSIKDKHLVGQSVTLDFDVEYLLKDVDKSDYEVSVSVSDGTVAEYADGAITFLKGGSVTVTVEVTAFGKTATNSYDVTVLTANRIENSAKSYTLWLNVDGKPSTTAIVGDVYVDDVKVDNPTFTLTGGGDVVTLVNGTTLKALKAGKVTATLTSVQKDTIYTQVEIEVHDTYVQRDGSEFVLMAPWSDSTGSYEQESQAVGVRTGVYKYSSNVNNWSNKISVRETNHVGKESGSKGVYGSVSEARQNMVNKGYKYVTFDVYMVSGRIVINVPDSSLTSGDASRQSNARLSTTALDNRSSLISFYVKSQGVYTQATTFTANTWYTVVVKYDSASTGTYAGIDIGCMDLNTVAYFDNVRYYYDGSWLLDYNPHKALTVDTQSIKDKQYIGDKVALDLNVEYLLETVDKADYELSVSSTNSEVAKYENGEISFLSAGQATITVEVTAFGKTVTNSYDVNVVKANRVDGAVTEYTLYLNIAGKSATTDIVGDVYVDGVIVENPTFTMTGGGDVVTLENGITIKALKRGKVTVTLTSVDSTDITFNAVVEVQDTYIQKDGSELVYTTTDGAVGNYGLIDQTVGERTGVYKYSSTAKEWTHKLNVKVGGHLNSADGPAKTSALREFVNSGYKYVSFDLYMEAGAYVMVSGLMPDNTYLADTLETNKAVTEKNSNINVYTNGATASFTTSGVWYTVVVDYSQIDADLYAQTARVYSRIEIGGINGTVYFDNVRYYFDDAWKKDFINANGYVQRDGSDFVLMASWNDTTGSYAIDTNAVGGRTNTYKYSSTAGGWANKISVKEANHVGKASGSTPGVYSSVSEARNNMLGRNYKYVAFDICMTSGGLVVNAPDANSTAASGQTYDKISTTGIASKGCEKIKYYTVDGNGVYTEVTTFTAGTWYTVVVEYDGSATGTYAGIDICSNAVNTVVNFDNVRYYNASPVVTAVA